MKKILIGTISVILIFVLVGFGPFKEMKDKIDELRQPEHEKIEDARGILDKVLEHIAAVDPHLSFEDEQLLDSELGMPRFEILSFSEIKQINAEDVVDGYLVQPVVNVDNPRLLIILQAVDKEASINLDQALKKVQSDHWVNFKAHNIWIRHLINEGKITRQGNFLIYAIWEDSIDIVKVFEQHVR